MIIDNQQLKTLGFNEYDDGCFTIDSDIGTLEYHQDDNIMTFGNVCENVIDFNHLKGVVKSRHNFECDMIYGIDN